MPAGGSLWKVRERIILWSATKHYIEPGQCVMVVSSKIADWMGDSDGKAWDIEIIHEDKVQRFNNAYPYEWHKFFERVDV